jgi:hypothetical protein
MLHPGPRFYLEGKVHPDLRDTVQPLANALTTALQAWVHLDVFTRDLEQWANLRISHGNRQKTTYHGKRCAAARRVLAEYKQRIKDIIQQNGGRTMVDASKYVGGQYLKGIHIPQPILVTIAGVEEEPVGKDEKLIVYFKEDQRGLVLNDTNTKFLIEYLASANTDLWQGQQVVLYNDPNVSYGGKKTGGLRLAKPQQQMGQPQSVAIAQPVQAQAAAPMVQDTTAEVDWTQGTPQSFSPPDGAQKK